MFRVVVLFGFEVGKLASGFAITVLAGFDSEYASIPARALHIVDAGALARSAMLHDFLRERLVLSNVEDDAILTGGREGARSMSAAQIY